MHGFAVIDFETTGLFPGRGDRVVEVAVVHVDPDGTVTGTWDTLVNPRRDLGPQHIHGIRSSDVLDAPTFEQIAPRLIELLSERTIVAHNASFDTRFLIAELTRIGYTPDLKTQALCTMQLATEFLPGSGRSLADCCAAYDIELTGAHRASVDALATARLLEAYILGTPLWQGWADYAAASGVAWPALTGGSAQPTQWRPREASAVTPRSFLERIAGTMSAFAGSVEELDYLALLDRCLLDRQLSVHESTSLVEFAAQHGVSRSACEQLHARYFTDLARAAWADGILTATELADLAAVAELLSIPNDILTAAMHAPTPEITAADPLDLVEAFVLRSGDLVVLTGDMRRSRDEWHVDLIAGGYVPWTGVTKKVRVLVAADPDSLSGKARKARDYGIPVVDEAWLGRMLQP